MPGVIRCRFYLFLNLLLDEFKDENVKLRWNQIRNIWTYYTRHSIWTYLGVLSSIWVCLNVYACACVFDFICFRVFRRNVVTIFLFVLLLTLIVGMATYISINRKFIYDINWQNFLQNKSHKPNIQTNIQLYSHTYRPNVNTVT